MVLPIAHYIRTYVCVVATRARSIKNRVGLFLKQKEQRQLFEYNLSVAPKIPTCRKLASTNMNVEKRKCAMKERGLFKGASSKLKKWDGIDALLQDWVSI